MANFFFIFGSLNRRANWSGQLKHKKLINSLRKMLKISGINFWIGPNHNFPHQSSWPLLLFLLYIYIYIYIYIGFLNWHILFKIKKKIILKCFILIVAVPRKRLLMPPADKTFYMLKTFIRQLDSKTHNLIAILLFFNSPKLQKGYTMQRNKWLNF